jgi:hypothetical protein
MSIVSLVAAKQHLRVSSSDDDAYLLDLIDIAEHFVADELNMSAVDLGTAPLPVVQAVKFLLAHWYENREPVTNGNVTRSVPLSYDSIIYKYRAKSFL